MEEQRVGLIPKLWVGKRRFPADMAAYVTNLRTILVEEKQATRVMPVPLLGVLAAAALSTQKERTSMDYAFADPNKLASLPGSIVWPHSNIREVRAYVDIIAGATLQVYLVKGPIVPPFQLVRLIVPDELMERRKAQGQKGREILKEYALEAQSLLRSALPPEVVEKSRWTK